MNFNFAHEPVFEWKGGNSTPRCHINSCLKGCKMISKECSYHIVRLQDLYSEISPIASAPVVKEAPLVFSNDLPDIPHERGIDFGIDFLPDTNYI